MTHEYVPSGATRTKLEWLKEQLEVVREQDPERYKATTEGMQIALGAIRTACDQLEQVIGSVP